MGQITRDFAESMLSLTDPNRPDHGQHAPLTVWEEHQLIRAWLDREELRERCKRLEAALLEANDFCRSAFQIANRIATEMGTHALQTNFGAFADRLDEVLKRHHELLRPLRKEIARAALGETGGRE